MSDVTGKVDLRPAGCCGSVRRGMAEPAAPSLAQRASDELVAAVHATLVSVPAGFFEMGARQPRYPDDGEGPVRRVFTSAYRISR